MTYGPYRRIYNKAQYILSVHCWFYTNAQYIVPVRCWFYTNAQYTVPVRCWFYTNAQHTAMYFFATSKKLKMLTPVTVN